MSFPVSSGRQPVAASAALDAPRTLRKSRRLTPARFRVVAHLSSGSWRSRSAPSCARPSRPRGVAAAFGTDAGLRRVPGGLESFLRAVAVHVTADAPAHVEARELVDAIHVLDLPVTRLAGHAGVDVARVREVHVLGKLVDAHPTESASRSVPCRAPTAVWFSVLVELLRSRRSCTLVARGRTRDDRARSCCDIPCTSTRPGVPGPSTCSPRCDSRDNSCRASARGPGAES